ncbi:hypothetical protein GQX73_g7398 [Xylaria multiplex]|uniref:Uncharacterized protein n=1 Tax=Xylaria multiplex TaxID=323545 RepID=A0A7C8IP87_9PEZI|nr:hypothetical protein GQX73_g7398 [Xylaria multiplex]
MATDNIQHSKPPEITLFQLYLAPSEADYHTLNEGDEINRSNVTDDATDGFVILVSLEKAIHDTGPSLNSFVGLHFVFRGANDKRRFKVVSITVHFEDETKPAVDDPEVVHIWPDRDYTWQGMTRERTHTMSVGVSAKASLAGFEFGPEGRWQREEKFVRNTPARLSGHKTLLNRRAGSHKNAVAIRMSENAQEESGVLRELRAGILLRRKRAGPNRFLAKIDIKAEADFRYDIVRGWKKLVGSQHVTDPIVFQPNVNFFDENNVAGINNDLPSLAMVEAYGKAAMSTELPRGFTKGTGEGGDVAEEVLTSS